MQATELLTTYLPKEPTKAGKITNIEQSPVDEVSDPPGGTWRLYLDGAQSWWVTISYEFYRTWRPMIGHYYVLLPGGVKNIHPADLFEPNYAPLTKVDAMKHVIPLDFKTKLQMCVVMLTSGSEVQKLEALKFLSTAAED